MSEHELSRSACTSSFHIDTVVQTLGKTASRPHNDPCPFSSLWPNWSEVEVLPESTARNIERLQENRKAIPLTKPSQTHSNLELRPKDYR